MGFDTARIPRDVSTTWLNRDIPKNVADPDAYRAAKGFEAYFARQLVKEMIGSADFVGGKGSGGEIYQDMFKSVLGDEIANSGGLGITEMIYRKVMQNKGQKPFLDANEQQASEIGQIAQLVPMKMGRYASFVDHAAKTHDVEPELLFAVMRQESGGDPNAVSHAGAKGLMQLIDSTAAEMGVSDSFDPVQNIHGGAKYLREQLDQFSGNIDHALAAYNAGPGAVKKYGGIPPYEETQHYVKSVKAIYGRLKDQVAKLAKKNETSTDYQASTIAELPTGSKNVSKG